MSRQNGLDSSRSRARTCAGQPQRACLYWVGCGGCVVVWRSVALCDCKTVQAATAHNYAHNGARSDRTPVHTTVHTTTARTDAGRERHSGAAADVPGIDDVRVVVLDMIVYEGVDTLDLRRRPKLQK